MNDGISNMKMHERRVLIISNTCLSQSDSNGRTLMNLLMCFDKNKLAQFYIHGQPDFSACSNYYQVSDQDALTAFKKIGKFTKDGRVFLRENASAQKNVNLKKTERKIPRNCRNLYLRNIIWNSFKWWNDKFDRFLKECNPEVVLLQAGDCPFMYNIAVKIATKFSIPLIIFNTENYVLKKVLYSKASAKNVFHFLLKRSLRKEFSKAIKLAAHCIYNTEYLQARYREQYPDSPKSSVLYITSNLVDCNTVSTQNDTFSLVYCGNLGVGRTQTLCSMAKVLAQVNEKAVLKIYGQFVNEHDKEELCAQANVEYNGFVSYNEIPKIISQSSMVIHSENKDNLSDLVAAFSTKIADSLACGKPFLVYASKEFPFCEYLWKNKAAHIAQNEDELFAVLQKCINDLTYRNQYIENAKELAQKNHNLMVNAEKMFKIINGVEEKREVV